MGEGGKAYTQLVRSIPTNLSGYILNVWYMDLFNL